MPKLDTLTLRVTNPEAQRQFYRDVMGMQELEDGRLRYRDEEAALAFVPVEKAYEPQKSDLYWKIAIAVPNLDLACEQLAAKGVGVTEPHQFRDVGYLAHTSDPEGFSIELIEHWFEGERPDASYDETLLGGGPHFNLITLRTSDIAAVEPEILAWGMKPLSVQPVEPYGFTLYFYTFTDETPPDPDLKAIENRTWVYQRPYTVLELQHVLDFDTETQSEQYQAGYEGIRISPSDAQVDFQRLRVRSE